MRRSIVACVGVALAVLAGCAVSGGGTGGGAAAPDAGPAQRGGSAVLLQVTEPRTLDPAVLTNAFAGNGVVGNALFGTLLTTDQDTGELGFGLAEELTSADGGLNWTLTLRDGLKFSDGTPLDAAAVKVNWDRIKEPTVGSQSLPIARYVATTTATDARTLTFTLSTPVANFGQSIAGSSMNWIGSPAALAAGQQAFDATPIGAGPFVLTAWARQDKMEFARNPNYFDPERPYLDTLTMRTNTDENQRLATLTSGAADLMISINPQLADKAEASGMSVTRQELNGGNGLLFNTAVAPFSDPVAREALTRAIDLEALNTAVYSGKGAVPTTLFRNGSPFFSDIPLTGFDHAAAQALFDRLGGLSFTMTSYPTSESQAVVEAIQAQLATYTGVDAKIEVLDFAGATAKLTQRQFQAIINGVVFLDPEITLWNSLHSAGPGNYIGIKDPQLDAALDAGRTTTDTAARKTAYTTATELLVDQHPFLLYVRTAPAMVLTDDLHGAQMYGIGSLLPEHLWTSAAS